MNRDTAVRTWREVCGSDTVMAMGVVTGRMLEQFATRIEAAERERCAAIAREVADGCTDCDAHDILARILKA